MTGKKQPEALHLADRMIAFTNRFKTPSYERGLCNGVMQELRRLHAENESLCAELRRQHAALSEWFEKTEWVRKTAQPNELGKHLVDVLRERIDKLQAENATIQAGYAAARLEIESLRARSVEPAGEYPALPEASAKRYGDFGFPPELLFTADQMEEYVEADRAMRAAHPAGAQQPGTAYAELPSPLAWAHWEASGFSEEPARLAIKTSPPDEHEKRIANWFPIHSTDKMRTFADATHAIRASHGQAPAQAAPAAVAGPSERIVAWRVTMPSMFKDRAFPGGWIDGAPSQKELADFKDNAPQAVIELAYAAPTTQPAPKQEAQEPFGYVNTNTGQFFADVEHCRKNNEGHWRTVYTAPQPSPASQGDAERLDWLRDNSCDLRCVDSATGQGDGDIHWSVIEHHMAKPQEREIGRAYRDDPRAAIDAARAAQEGKQ